MAISYKIPKLSGTLSNGQWRNGQNAAVDICERRGVSMHLICSSAKTQIIVSVRDEIVALLNGWGWSTTQIGNLLCKNHSMVVYALQRIKAGLPRSDGVHSGSDETIGPREVSKDALCDDENAERQDDVRDSDKSSGDRDGRSDLGGSSEQRRPHGAREGFSEGTASLHRGEEPGSTTNNAS